MRKCLKQLKEDSGRRVIDTGCRQNKVSVLQSCPSSEFSSRERSDIRHEPPPGAQRSRGAGVLGAVMHEVVGMNVMRRATSATIASGARHSSPPSAASQQTSTAVADPDRKAPSPSSRLPINLQINEQTSHRERDHRLITGAPIIERLRCGHIDYGSLGSCDYGGVGHAGLDYVLQCIAVDG